MRYWIRIFSKWKKYFGPYKKAIIISMILSLLSTGLGMVQPYFAKIFIDQIIIKKAFNLLIYILPIPIGLLFLSFGIRILNSYIYTHYSANLLFRMREDLFIHLHNVSLSVFFKKKLGDIYSRIATDIANIQTFLTDIFPRILINFFSLLFIGSILIILNLSMAIMTFCSIPFVLIILVKLRPKLFNLAQKIAEFNAEIGHFILESLYNTVIIRSFGRTENETFKLKLKHNNFLNILLKYQLIGAMNGLIPIITTVINTLIVFGYGTFLVINEKLTIGSLIAFSIYQSRLLIPIRGILEDYVGLQKIMVSINRVNEILEFPLGIKQNGNIILNLKRFQGEIVFDKVTFGYEPEKPVIQDVSFVIPPKKISVLIGPSGSGKSTICYLLLRLFDNYKGKITLDGIDIRNIDIRWLRSQISFVPQDIFLFHGTIFENICFAKPTASKKEVERAARDACLHDFISQLPNGYNEIIGDRGIKLSGGQRQRLGIARALLRQPKILILDEPTAFLDTVTEDELKNHLKLWAQNKTLLIITHRSSIMSIADYVIRCEYGKIIEESFIPNVKVS